MFKLLKTLIHGNNEKQFTLLNLSLMVFSLLYAGCAAPNTKISWLFNFGLFGIVILLAPYCINKYLLPFARKVVEDKLWFTLFGIFITLIGFVLWPVSKATANFHIYSATGISGNNFSNTFSVLSAYYFILFWVLLISAIMMLAGLGIALNKSSDEYSLSSLSSPIKNEHPLLYLFIFLFLGSVATFKIVSSADNYFGAKDHFVKHLVLKLDMEQNRLCTNISNSNKILTASNGVSKGKVIVAYHIDNKAGPEYGLIDHCHMRRIKNFAAIKKTPKSSDLSVEVNNS